jgi:hypothetical protein
VPPGRAKLWPRTDFFLKFLGPKNQNFNPILKNPILKNPILKNPILKNPILKKTNFEKNPF